VDDGDKGRWSAEHLPSSWRWVSFNEFWTDHTDSKRKIPQNSYLTEGTFPVIDQGANLIGGYANDSTKSSLAPLPVIIFGDHTRATKYFDRPFIQGADGVRILCAAHGVDPLFAYHSLRCVQLPDKGYSRHFRFLKATQFPLAPLSEQRRIVAKIDSLSAKSKRAREQLNPIPRFVEKYKQSILAAAFRGEFTRVQRGIGTRDSEWSHVSAGTIIEDIVAGKNLRCEERPPKENENGVVKVSAVTWGAFNPLATKTLPKSFVPPPQTRIQPGDFLLSRANTLELVGAVVIVKQTPANLFLSDKILRLEIAEETKPWLLWFLRSPDGRSAIEGSATGNQLSMRNLSQSALRNIQVPWTNADERREIVSRIETAFSWIDRLASETTSTQRLIDHLDQAILAKAFRGELVPQDPNDEPASVLLERIKAERAGQAATEHSRRARK